MSRPPETYESLWVRLRRWLAMFLEPEPDKSGKPSEPLDIGAIDSVGSVESVEELRPEQLEAVERARLAVEQRLQVEFERNLRQPTRLRALEFSSVDFFADTTWEFRPTVNVLLGRNGFGKSLLLRALAGMLQRDERVTANLFDSAGTGAQLKLRLTRDGHDEEIVRDEETWRGATVGRIPLLAIPDSRFTDRRVAIVPEPDTLDLASQGAFHVLEQLPYQSVVESLLWSLCLDYWEHDRSFDLPTFHLLQRVIRRLTDETFEFDSIERIGRTGYRMWVRTEGLDRPLPIQQASQGTLSVLTMFGVIQAYLQAVRFAASTDRRSDPGEVVNQQAIVLIDEVDAHLHPIWQQKIRNLLTEVFPNVQFLLSAHSPLVVAGCGPYEVSVMRRSSEGFAIQQIDRDFVGASAQDLYREIFEVEDLDENFLRYATEKARGGVEEVEKRIDKLAQREEKGKLSPDEAEELDTLLVDRSRMQRVAEVEADRRDEQQRAVDAQAEIERLRRQRDDLKRRLQEFERVAQPEVAPPEVAS